MTKEKNPGLNITREKMIQLAAHWLLRRVLPDAGLHRQLRSLALARVTTCGGGDCVSDRKDFILFPLTSKIVQCKLKANGIADTVWLERLWRTMPSSLTPRRRIASREL
jgi:hypothetical protein